MYVLLYNHDARLKLVCSIENQHTLAHFKKTNLTYIDKNSKLMYGGSIGKERKQKMTQLYHLLRLCRPKQWIKNVFVFSGIIFSGRLFYGGDLSASILIFVYFCIASSLVYILNDMVDIEKDKLHPDKKNRPLAAGDISKATAMLWFAILLGVFLMGFLWMPTALIIMTIYIVINIAYSFFLKHMVIIDMFTIASGFVLRVIAGTIGIGAIPSPWLLLCTLFLSLFLGFGKRKNELLVLDMKQAAGHRSNLQDYSIHLVDQWMGISTAVTIMAYSLYTFSAFDHLWMMATIPFVIFGLFRYQYLVEVRQAGGQPEQVIFSELPFLINGLLWGISVMTIFYVF